MMLTKMIKLMKKARALMPTAKQLHEHIQHACKHRTEHNRETSLI